MEHSGIKSYAIQYIEDISNADEFEMSYFHKHSNVSSLFSRGVARKLNKLFLKVTLPDSDSTI